MKNENADQRRRRLALKRAARRRRRNLELPSAKERRLAKNRLNQNRRRGAVNSKTRNAYNAKRRERVHRKQLCISQSETNRNAIRAQHTLAIKDACDENDVDTIFEIDKTCFPKESFSRSDIASYVPGARDYIDGRRSIFLIEDDIIVACLLLSKWCFCSQAAR